MPIKDVLDDIDCMINTLCLPIRDLVERFIDVDKEFTGKPWNIMQILKNIDMVIPLEDRK